MLEEFVGCRKVLFPAELRHLVSPVIFCKFLHKGLEFKTGILIFYFIRIYYHVNQGPDLRTNFVLFELNSNFRLYCIYAIYCLNRITTNLSQYKNNENNTIICIRISRRRTQYGSIYCDVWLIQLYRRAENNSVLFVACAVTKMKLNKQ